MIIEARIQERQLLDMTSSAFAFEQGKLAYGITNGHRSEQSVQEGNLMVAASKCYTEWLGASNDPSA
jgi:hypothetical protein